MPEAGAPARFPSVHVPALDGPSRDLSQVAQTTLLVLGHGDCDTTRLLLPFLQRIHGRRRAGTEVALLLQDNAEDARALVRELELTLPVLLDPEPWPVGTALAARTVPLTLLLGPGGVVQGSWAAFRRDEVERAAAHLGVAPLFTEHDVAPALRPG
jgi:hypothetical protein